MREIKFRAWNKEMKYMSPVGTMCFEMWVEIYFPEQVPPDGEIDWQGGQAKWGDVDIMQFTGLKDKNGKEIYEGDIVVKGCYIWFDEGKPNYRGTVEWLYSQWQVVAHCINPAKRGISDGINEGINDEGIYDGEKSHWEIIGNIYETPELLTSRTE